MQQTDHKPGYVYSVLSLKCPCCRKGNMFIKGAYSRHFMKMNDSCQVCGQPMEIEVGFYYGTSYVSYAITVVLSMVSFVLWWIFIGFSYSDHRFLYWVSANGVLLLGSQPYLMRLSRTLWLSFFVKYGNPKF
jgi:uncharacterized protein (DUF983 family)